MELTRKSFELTDYRILVALAAGNEEMISQLSILKMTAERMESGDHRSIGHPDSIVIATYKDQIVGYRHWYTDCWEDYKRIEIGTAIQKSLEPHKQRFIEAFLQYHYDEEMLDGI